MMSENIQTPLFLVNKKLIKAIKQVTNEIVI